MATAWRRNYATSETCVLFDSGLDLVFAADGVEFLLDVRDELVFAAFSLFIEGRLGMSTMSTRGMPFEIMRVSNGAASCAVEKSCVWHYCYGQAATRSGKRDLLIMLSQSSAIRIEVAEL